MHTSASRGNYTGRVDRVVTWLTDHLDEALDLARLAEVACLSPYHFHRMHQAMQGETVAATVRRLRLHRAAVEPIDGALPVRRIARRAGYRSQAAFTRAFRAAYDTPPARYRSSLVSSPRRRLNLHPSRFVGRRAAAKPRRVTSDVWIATTNCRAER